MKEIDSTTQHKIVQDFVNGKSAKDICKNENITPIILLELLKEQTIYFHNELFDLPAQQNNHFSITQEEHTELLAEKERLTNQLKEYEIEIRIHQDLLDKIVSKN